MSDKTASTIQRQRHAAGTTWHSVIGQLCLCVCVCVCVCACVRVFEQQNLSIFGAQITLKLKKLEGFSSGNIKK